MVGRKQESYICWELSSVTRVKTRACVLDTHIMGSANHYFFFKNYLFVLYDYSVAVFRHIKGGYQIPL